MTSAPSEFSARGIVLAALCSLGLLLGGFGAWAGLSRIEAAVILPGQVISGAGNYRIEHAEGGQILQILVSEGARVTRGQVLARLDPADLPLQLARLTARIESLTAEELRLAALAAGARRLSLPRDLPLSLMPELIEQAQLLAAETRLSDAEGRQYRQRLDQIDGRIEGLIAELAARDHQEKLIRRRLAELGDLSRTGALPRNSMGDLDLRLSDLRANQAGLRASLAEIGAMRGEVAQDHARREAERRAERAARTIALSRELADLRGQAAALQQRLDRRALRATADGWVHDLLPQAENSFLPPGVALMRIVPAGAENRILVLIPPREAEAIQPGQPVRILPDLPRGRRGAPLSGTLVQLSADTSPGEGAAQPPAYRAEIRLTLPDSPGPRPAPLRPGQTVTTFIRTGQHSPLDYLLGPLRDQIDRALRES